MPTPRYKSLTGSIVQYYLMKVPSRPTRQKKNEIDHKSARKHRRFCYVKFCLTWEICFAKCNKKPTRQAQKRNLVW